MVTGVVEENQVVWVDVGRDYDARRTKLAHRAPHLNNR
jgi:hypothetical protein